MIQLAWSEALGRADYKGLTPDPSGTRQPSKGPLCTNTEHDQTKKMSRGVSLKVEISMQVSRDQAVGVDRNTCAHA